LTLDNPGAARHDLRSVRHKSVEARPDPGPDRHDAHLVCSAGNQGSGAEADPLITALRWFRGFLRAGWSFNTRLAERMPQVYLAGWSL
jgi:hypothetical protein